MSGEPARTGPGRAPVPRWILERDLPGRRLFIGVPLSSDARDDVVRLVEGVRASLGAQSGPERGGPSREVRWVRMDGLHLTLRFLGPTLDERMPALVDAIQGAVAGVTPFRVRLAGGGAFPGPDRPRVLWLGVAEGVDRLGDLARSLEDRLVSAGWLRDERPFRAHLTLARSDGVAAGPATARALVAAAEAFRAEWTADRLMLFESHTGAGPARYEALSEVSLGG